MLLVYYRINGLYCATVHKITQITYFFPRNCHIDNPRICARQSIVIQEASADTSRRVRGIAKKDLQIICRIFERLVFWESLGLSLSVTTISDFKNYGLLCNYYIYDRARNSMDRAWMFCRQNTNILLRGNSPELATEFSEICRVCVSYLWRVPYIIICPAAHAYWQPIWIEMVVVVMCCACGIDVFHLQMH